MTQKIVFFIVIILVLLACKEDTSAKQNITSNSKVHQINISDSKNLKTSFSDYIKDFEYLELKTNSGNYITEVTKVEIFKNEIYVLDRKKI
jgi:outer membrane biogenesis lipoprotein LolB